MEWQSIQLLSVHRRPANPKSRYQEKRSTFFSRLVPFPLPLPPHTTNNRPYSLGFLLLVCLPAWISSPSFDSTTLIKCTPPSVYYYCFRYKRYRFLGLSFFCSFTSLLHRDGGAWMTDCCLVYQYNFHRLCMERRRFGSFGGSGTKFLRHTLQNKTVNNDDLVGRSSWSGNMLYSMVICCDRTFPPGLFFFFYSGCQLQSEEHH